MSFYLKPPRGLVNLHTFQNCTEQRLNCYDFMYSDSEVEISNFDCLVDDSPLDRTGHYLFRLYAYFSTSFRFVFLENEKKLLLLRLTSYYKEDVKYFLKRLLKHSRECLYENGVHENLKQVYICLIYLCSDMLNREFLNHIFKQVHGDTECDKFTIKVPFYLCASLIFHREVKLNKGYAEIQCVDWKKLFLSIYETYLRKAINEMGYSQNVQLAASDIRIRNAFEIIQNHCFKDKIRAANTAGSKFNISNIELESKFFPLCMLNLFKVLQKSNRLAHDERFDFSLFMKSVGVSLSDSITFWQNAYSKQHSSCSKCSHSWKDSEKRYIYGIRHLYGLEGSRKNYTVRSCNYFQEKILGATDDGGCPFKHFDDNNLRQLLKIFLFYKEDDIEVMIYERKTNPSKSCKLFFDNVFKTNTGSSTSAIVSFNNPAEYYLLMKKFINATTT